MTLRRCFSPVDILMIDIICKRLWIKPGWFFIYIFNIIIILHSGNRDSALDTPLRCANICVDAGWSHRWVKSKGKQFVWNGHVERGAVVNKEDSDVRACVLWVWGGDMQRPRRTWWVHRCGAEAEGVSFILHNSWRECECYCQHECFKSSKSTHLSTCRISLSLLYTYICCIS